MENKKKASLSIEKITLYCFMIAAASFNVYVYVCKKIDIDILWHYKLGEEIIQNKCITLANNFTFLKDTEWLPQEWIYETMLYIITSKIGMIGFFGLTFLNTILLISLALKNIDNKIIFMIGYIIMWYSTPRNMGNRPSEFSVYFILLSIYLYNKNIGKLKKVLLLLFGILVANFHGGVILIISALWLIMLANDIFFDIYTKNRLSIKAYLSKALEFILFIIGTCINPSGFKLLSTIVKISTLNTTQYIAEWLPTEVNYILGIFIILITISFGYYIGKQGIKREDTQIMLINAGLLVLALHSQKAFLVFDAVWIIYCYKYLEYLISDVFKGKSLRIAKIANRLRVLVPALLIVVSIASISLVKETVTTNNFNDYVVSVSEQSSNDVLNNIKDVYTDDTKILAGYKHGNTLVFNNIKCFVDTRQWPYSKELSKYSALDDLFYVETNLQDTEYIDNFLNKYNFDYIWTSSELDLNNYFKNNGNYSLVMSTDTKEESLWKRNK